MDKINSVLAISILLVSSGIIAVSSATDECKIEIVESMPEGMVLPARHVRPLIVPTPTADALLDLINGAKESLKIASFYWTLTSSEDHESIKEDDFRLPGKQIYDAILEAASKRKVKLEIVTDGSKEISQSSELDALSKVGDVRYLNMTKLLKSGVLHTKFLIADKETFYLGSSNMDWRSYTQIKEIGIKMNKCPTLADDLNKIFLTYQLLAESDSIPGTLPDNVKTTINMKNPIHIELFNQNSSVFLGASPPAFNGNDIRTGRTDDIDGLLQVINGAKRFIDISVMNYGPRTEFIWPKKFWPRIDDALRSAASERQVQVRLLFSNWSHTSDEQLMWYRSLDAIQSKALKGGGIQVKLFTVPAFNDIQRKIPYARVKHDKYMVSDYGVYIGTSNWTPDYFINTCGVSFIAVPGNANHSTERKTSSSPNIIDAMRGIFVRDFSSEYSASLPVPTSRLD